MFHVRSTFGTLLYGIFILLTALLLSNCGDTSVMPVGEPQEGPPRDPHDCHKSDCPPDPVCDGVAQFTQDTNQFSKLDVLLAIDTSGSMEQELLVIGQQFEHFFSEMQTRNPALDYQIGVLLAHIDSPHTGVFWQPTQCTNPPVIHGDESTNFATEIQPALSCKLENFVQPSTYGGSAHSEAGLHTLYHATTTKLSENKAKGFFRSAAGLAVIIAADENDVCSGIPNLWNNYWTDSTEDVTRSSNFCQGITPANIYNSLTAVMGGAPIFVGAVVNTDIENSHYGWGYLGSKVGWQDDWSQDFGAGLVDLAGANGLSVQITTNANDTLGNLQSLGDAAVHTFEKKTVFTVPSNALSISSVKVAGTSVTFSFVSSTHQIQIPFGEAGQDGDRIEINYCYQP